MWNVDVTVTRAINGFAGQSGLLDTVMIWASAAGIPLLVLAVAGQWRAKPDRQDTRHVLVAAGLSFILGLAINQIILLFVDRVRPYAAGVSELLIAPSLDPSFPSDHATAVFAIAATFVLHQMPKRAAWFALAALAVAISRIYVGTHYASDVLGGALSGASAAILIFLLYQRGTRIDRFITNIL
nr:phosphatase PAP2 family protein [Pararhizobium sp. IMCC3301]